jgi:hypothetical protein
MSKTIGWNNRAGSDSVRTSATIVACGLLLAFPLQVMAGMPALLPTDPARTLRLGDSPLARLQAISFFLLVFLISAVALRAIWNYLQRDFPILPRLSYGRAVAGVFLWGVLFVIVLTMISGARELMTPGAWRKQGATYKLADNPTSPTQPESDLAIRRHHLEQFRTALWQFAATHGGRFPGPDDVSAIPAELWEVPHAGGMRYLYVAGRSAGYLPDILAYEPELDPDQRLVLRVNGDIVEMRSADVRSLNVPAGPVGSTGRPVDGKKP